MISLEESVSQKVFLMADTNIYDLCKRKSLLEKPSPPLQHMSFIYHLVRFKKDQTEIQALPDPGSKINVMPLAYLAKLGLKDQPTNIEAQEINGSILKTLRMVLVSFQFDYYAWQSPIFSRNLLTG